MARWVKIPGTLSCISVGGPGLVASPQSSELTPATQILWGVNKSGAILFADFSNGIVSEWRPLSGNLIHIAAASEAGSDGQCAVWGTTKGNSIYRLRSTGGKLGWERKPGALQKVAVCRTAVWGVTPDGKLAELVTPAGSPESWKLYDDVKSTAVAVTDNAVWVVGSDGTAATADLTQPTRTWTKMDAKLLSITVWGALVCAIRNDGVFVWFSDGKWSELSDGQPHEFVYCSTNGASVWALDRQDGIWLWAE